MKQGLENLKKFLDQMINSFEDNLEESHLFNILKERYEALSTLYQKIFKYGIIASLIFLLFLTPLALFLSSSSHWSEFKTKYNLSVKLLNLRSRPASPLPSFSSFQIKNQIQLLIKKYQKDNFTIKNISTRTNRKTHIKTEEFQITINHLNIKQAIQLSSDLNSLSQTTLKALDLKENTDYTNHYDTTLNLIHYSINTETPPAPSRSSRKGPKKAKTRKKIKSNASFVLPPSQTEGDKK